MRRIAYFVATNLAVMLVVSFVMKFLGVEGYLYRHGLGLNLSGLLIFCAVMGCFGSLLSLLMSKPMAIRATGARVITAASSPLEEWLLASVRRLSAQAGIEMPDVAVFDSADANAFATGWNRNKALVAVSTGLLYAMDKNEAEAVLGHEITHVANGDMVTMALLQGVLNTFVLFLARVIGMLVDRSDARGPNGEVRGYGAAYMITTMVLEIVLGFLASIIVMWFSRQREFRADAGGAQLAGRDGMIGALQTLQNLQRRPALPQQLAAFGISGPVRSGLQRLFMSHPPLEERIEALRSLPIDETVRRVA